MILTFGQMALRVIQGVVRVNNGCSMMTAAIVAELLPGRDGIFGHGGALVGSVPR